MFICVPSIGVLFLNPIQVAFAFVVVNLSLYLGFGAEVEKQADFAGGGFEIIKKLGFMFGGDGAGGFEFDDDRIVDEQIGEVFSDDLACIVDGNAGLLFDFEAEAAEFYRESIFVDFFEKSIAEGVVDSVEGFDDEFGEVFVFGFHIHCSLLPDTGVDVSPLPRSFAHQSSRSREKVKDEG